MQNRLSDDPPLITLKDVTLRVRDRLILSGTSWEIRSGEHWAVVGPNGAGKTTLVRALAGKVPAVRGAIERHAAVSGRPSVGYVSFELHRDLISRETDLDSARFFSRNFDNPTTPGKILQSSEDPCGCSRRFFQALVERLKLDGLMDRSLRCLSTGEMRKLLIARALLKRPRLLILDEPFDGLDTDARKRLAETIGSLINGALQVILVTHRPEEIFPQITHILHLGLNGVQAKGTRESISSKAPSPPSAQRVPAGRFFLTARTGCRNRNAGHVPEELVHMKNVTIRYGDVFPLRHLTWTMRRGENWAVVGPNGAGKTTLLRLIYADIPQAYANEIRLFGRQRGTGESIWDIRRHIGMVGSEFQIHYRTPISSLKVVLSGFFDSVGLYRCCRPEQKAAARQWMAMLGIEDLADRSFGHLSYGEQRMVLIARALVKSPPLLLLDEPCQGLDRDNRSMVLDLIDWIGARGLSHLVYVTHHEEEMLPCISHVLRLGEPAGVETVSLPY